MSLLDAGIALGGTAVFYAGVVAVYSIHDRARQRAFRALARERDWEYHDHAGLPFWYASVPWPPSARGATGDPSEGRHMFAGPSRGHDVQLFEVVYPGGEETPDHVCTVAALLDPPRVAPPAVGSAMRLPLFRASAPAGRFAIEPAPSDELVSLAAAVAPWPEVEMWGTGEILWTVAKGELRPADVGRRLSALFAMADAVPSR